MNPRGNVLIETAEAISTPGLRFVDASWYLDPGRNGRAEFLDAHIPGAVYFDLDAVSDKNTDLPHMLPPQEEFAEAAGLLGLCETDPIVVYDAQGLFSAPRVWWTFKIFGATNVRVLNGGLPAWREAGGRVESGEARPAPARFDSAFHPPLLAKEEDVLAAVKHGRSIILDARPAGRFFGQEAEPRPGLRRGHMPGASSLPASHLTENGRLSPKEVIESSLARAGVDGDKPVITTCGSGVTAATLALALASLGREVRVYDGSFAEWGREGGGPLVAGVLVE